MRKKDDHVKKMNRIIDEGYIDIIKTLVI